jgi:hypothetical protein
VTGEEELQESEKMKSLVQRVMENERVRHLEAFPLSPQYKGKSQSLKKKRAAPAWEKYCDCLGRELQVNRRTRKFRWKPDGLKLKDQAED